MGSTRDAERRRWYLERFLEATDSRRVEGDGALEESGTDFLLEGRDGGVGVRLVELPEPPPESGLRAATVAFRRSVMEAAEREWRSDAGRPHVEAWVEFSAHEQTTSARERDDLAARLCELVEAGLPEPGAFARLVAGEEDEGEGSYPLVTPALTVARLPTYTGSTWHAVSGSASGEVDEESVRGAVERAGDPESGGLEGRDERWLVQIVESFRGPLLAKGLPNELDVGSPDEGFDRIWLYDPVANEVRELR